MTKFDEYRQEFIESNWIKKIEEHDLVLFVLFFIENYCMDICKRKQYKISRPPLPLKNMLALILLSEIYKIDSPRAIAELTTKHTDLI